ncbi:hypothetical protein BJX70DRAFT_387880 [Aspergillus crustosus]
MQRQENSTERRSAPDPECCVCLDSISLASCIRRLGCTHVWCVGCLKTHFLRATKDEQIFPPKCCGEPIDVANVEAVMSRDEMDMFRHAEVEYVTIDRPYCSNASCRRLLSLGGNQADRAICSSCRAYTRLLCKGSHHVEDDCSAGLELRATLSLAEQNGWQRCYACRTMVERIGGCSHMVCTCRAQFCYRCGSKWMTCGCHGFDERLMAQR